ncbi:3449_t:CDS:2 [Diversispora eburnea]|uniref:3449_t:CDS:1 n=1 Tax=Diversispora eburnea TaxID=1213867 RepID=A0A9N8WGK0_9GLOM|nr:3449_t:CDS:2 [Diversispora eburnea]
MSVASSDEEIVTKRQTNRIRPRNVKIKSRRVDSGVSESSVSTSYILNNEEPNLLNTLNNVSVNEDDDDKSVEMTEELNSENDSLQLTKLTEEGTSRRPTKKKKSKKDKRPDWTMSDDINFLSDSSPHNLSKKGKKGKKVKKVKVKEQDENSEDDRESSLTPPPELNEYQIKSTVGMIRATLMQYSERLRSDGNEISSPGISHEPQDDMELDPELLAIQQSIKQLHDKSNRNPNAKVEIKVIIIRHPETEPTTKKTEKPIKFIIRADDNFEQMIKHISEKREIRKQDLLLTYNKVKIFPRSTPQSLGMVGNVIIEAYTKDIYNYIKEKQNLEKKRLLETDSDKSENDKNSDVPDIEDDNYIYLKLRCQDESVEKLKVKKNLTVQAVIDKYKNIKNIPLDVKVKLLLEDETLKDMNKLEDTELEDGDMLSVVLN